ncbi:MAG: efflux RND transporter periplasmic adaptor subunit [Cyclobacteriaceae bacterium]
MIRILFLIGLISACTTRSAVQEKILIPQPGPVKVKVQTVKRKPVTRKIIGEGVVRAERTVMVQARGEGFVEKVFVRNGDRIKKGDTLLILERKSREHRLRLAEINLEQSRYTFESEKLGYMEQGELPDTIILALELSSGLARARLDFIKAREDLRNHVITSPAAGFLTDCTIAQGEAVVPGKLLARIVDTERYYLEVYLPETDFHLLRPGMRASGLSLAGDSVDCILDRVIPFVDEKGRIKTYWKIRNGSSLVPGQHCGLEGEIVLREGIFIPRSAIVQRGDNSVVFLAENDTARWVNVQTGWYSEFSVEIQSGVDPGDHVILSEQYAIDEGSPVEIVD